jgi:hypothetical protein
MRFHGVVLNSNKHKDNFTFIFVLRNHKTEPW